MVLCPFFPSRHDVMEHVESLRFLVRFTEMRDDLMRPADVAQTYREASSRCARAVNCKLIPKRVMQWEVLGRRLADGSADVLVATFYRTLSQWLWHRGYVRR